MGKRIGMVGTRFTPLHSSVWREQVAQIIASLPDDAVLVVNSAPGVDQEAANLAKARGLTVETLFPEDDYTDSHQYFVHRNAALVESADEIYAVWDGNSPGTRHAITLAKHRGVPVHVSNVFQKDWQRFS